MSKLPESSQSPSKVGVTVVSGFLGSGKTTLLQRIVRDPELGPRVAVIVNDLGSLGLDHELIASENSTPTLRVTELVSGCICCTLRSDLGEALMQLGTGAGLARRPEHILIEPSGIARASEVSFAVNALGFDAPVQTDAVITLVDAHNAARGHAEQPELFEDQLRSADLVLLNKGDLVTSPAAREALLAWIAPLAPRATFLWTERAAVAPELLLGRLRLEQPDSARHESPPHHVEHERVKDPAAHGFAALSLPVAGAVEQGALEDFLDAQADRIFRIKGIVDAWQRGDGPQPVVRPLLVQAVGDRVELDELPASSPLRTAARRLIFIGATAALDRTQLAAELEELCSRRSP